MGSVPINRTRALIISAPQDYVPARLREAERYLLDRQDATEEERRLATEAIEGLRSKRDDKPSVSKSPAAVKTKRKGKAQRTQRNGRGIYLH